jgi:hypothetical protein
MCEKIAKLREFLQRPTHQGGVFLITGQRGVGKTWLVEQALSQRRNDSVSDYLFGTVGRRERHAEPRQPRNLKRYFIKVDVDPFFPHNDKEQEQSPNELTKQLLLNIICALTCTIDSRLSVRKHGKVLSQRLGFWRFWFGNGLCWPEKNRNLLTGILYFLLGMLVNYSYILVFVVCSFIDEFLFPIASQLFIPISVMFAIGCFMFCRWLDWRSLQKMSEQLYAIAHAREYQQDHDETKTNQTEHKFNFSFILSLLVLVGLVCLVGSSISPHLSSTVHKILQQAVEDKVLAPLLVATVSFLIVITVIYSWSNKTNDGDHSKFDKTNPAWLVNLLRRYLFLCHRCGLEPVLVLDELDKLDELDDFSDQHPEKTKSSGFRMKKNKSPDRLILFLTALAKLKSSLGAEFLWILIGGPVVHRHLQSHRHERPDGNLGLLATVIHQEDVMGPMPFKDASDYLHNVFDISDINHQKYLWLRSYGNYSTLVREVANLAPTFTPPRLNILVDALIDLWEHKNDYLSFNLTAEIIDPVHGEWLDHWIRSGMFDASNRLLKSPLPDTYYFYQKLNEEVDAERKRTANLDDTSILLQEDLYAIRSNNPKLLRAVGASIFYRYLKVNRLIEDIDGSKIRFRT